VDLVDDLLEVASDERLKNLDNARVEPHPIEQRLVIGRPLHHADQRPSIGAGGHVVEEVAVPETPPVAHSFGVELIGRFGDFRDLVGAEETPDYRVTVAPVLREILLSGCRRDRPQRLRATHDSPPHTRENIPSI
jgi:hypothetical protein